MKFLIDRCAGVTLAQWLRKQGHDVAEATDKGPDPGDEELLSRASTEGRILVTLDKDFGALVFAQEKAHSGIVRLPDVPAAQRVALLSRLLEVHGKDMAAALLWRADQRLELEQLCRYITRPAIANERLKRSNRAGQVVLQLKSPYKII